MHARHHDDILWYRLEGQTPLPCTRQEAEALLRDGPARRIAYDELADGAVTVSTVFLVLDHGWQGEPVLFETMIFGGDLDGEQRRYHTYPEAEVGHAAMVGMARAVLDLQPGPPPGGIGMNYLDEIAVSIASAAGDSLTGPQMLPLYRGYAVLLLTLGHDVNEEAVHNAWAAWTATYNPDHAALIPFEDLPPAIQRRDAPYVAAIRQVCRQRLGID